MVYVSVPELEGSGLCGELPFGPLSLCPMGMGEEELLEDELEKGDFTTMCLSSLNLLSFFWGSSLTR